MHREAADEVFAGIGERRELFCNGRNGWTLILVMTDTGDLARLCKREQSRPFGDYSGGQCIVSSLVSQSLADGF